MLNFAAENGNRSEVMSRPKGFLSCLFPFLFLSNKLRIKQLRENDKEGFLQGCVARRPIQKIILRATVGLFISSVAVFDAI